MQADVCADWLSSVLSGTCTCRGGAGTWRRPATGRAARAGGHAAAGGVLRRRHAAAAARHPALPHPLARPSSPASLLRHALLRSGGCAGKATLGVARARVWLVFEGRGLRCDLHPAALARIAGAAHTGVQPSSANAFGFLSSGKALTLCCHCLYPGRGKSAAPAGHKKDACRQPVVPARQGAARAP